MQAETHIDILNQQRKSRRLLSDVKRRLLSIHPLPGNGIVEMMFETVQGKAQDSR